MGTRSVGVVVGVVLTNTIIKNAPIVLEATLMAAVVTGVGGVFRDTSTFDRARTVSLSSS